MSRIGIITTSHSGLDVVVEWKIDFFNLPESVCLSPSFFFGGAGWCLVIYLNDSSESDFSGDVDLELAKYSRGHSIKQSFSLSLKTVRGEKYNEEHFTKDFENYGGTHYLNRFIPRSELTMRRSELLPNGVLTVVCTMKSPTPAGSDSDSDSDSAERSSNSDSDSAERSDSDSGECCHKCSNCLDIVKKQKKLLEELESQKKRSEAEKSGNICVEASTQTTEENGNDLEKKSENTSMEACTQTDEENAENSENIHIEVSTQTGEENAVGDEWFKEKSRNACIEASTQTEEQNEYLKELSITELKKADTPEVVGSVEAEASGSNQTGGAGTKKSVPVDLCDEHDWVTNVSYFLKEGRGVDVTFELETPSGKTEFPAHQLILALRSPYFADAFYGTERNKGHLMISFKGIDPKAFEQMIRYCYDYKPCLRTTEDACALFKVAFEFKVSSLQKICRTFIKDSKIEAGNVFSVLEVSEQMEDKSLGDMCNKILQDKTRDVMATYELCDVTPVMVHTFLNLPNLSLNSEYELIKWIFDWAKVKSEDEDSSSENAREYLEKWLKDMNFLALTMEQFALLSLVNLPEEHDWVTDVCDFLKERRGVDVTFELETPSGKTEFIAHQLILALRSPYFADAFYGTERNNGHLRISLKRIDPKAFEQMIRYCYDCKPCLRTTEDACALFKVAF